MLPLTPAVFHILLSLSDSERHGYGISKEVAARTDGTVRLGPGTLYGTLTRLLAADLVDETATPESRGAADPRRRYYRLTPLGRAVARAEARRLADLVSDRPRQGHAPGPQMTVILNGSWGPTPTRGAQRRSYVAGFAVTSPILLAILAIVVPVRADAQWFAAAYLGANATTSATVSIDVPGEGLALAYHDVAFEARPFDSPQYYGARIGKLFGPSRRIGVEVEFIHLKVYAKTHDPYPTTGEFGTSQAAAGGPMNAIVQRYAMSHGLNFLVANLVTRTSLGGATSFIARAGFGPTLPHGETTVLEQSRDAYEYAGLGAHVAAGLDLRLRGRLSLVAEYKFTYASPRIDLARGTGEMTAATHHVAFGLAFGLAR